MKQRQKSRESNFQNWLMVELEQQEEVSSIENKFVKTHRSNNPTPKKEKKKKLLQEM